MLQEMKEENWALPIMYTVCLDLRILAQKCEEYGRNGQNGEILEKTAECLLGCFRVCAADNRCPFHRFIFNRYDLFHKI